MLEKIKKYISHDEPFGPIDASIINTEDSEVLRALFDPFNKINEAMESNPSLIIGRRGSGKTSFLHNIMISNKFEIVKELRASETFSQVVDTIEKNIPPGSFTEKVADIWEELFYTFFISEAVKKCSKMSAEFLSLNNYLAKQGISDASKVGKIFWRLAHLFNESKKIISASAIVEVIKEFINIDSNTAKKLVVDVMKNSNERAILLIDSLEDYPISLKTVEYAISGLLKCVGQFNKRNDKLKVCLCLPAEIYHVCMEISSNPIKDFNNVVMLHWVASELLSIAANRLNLYIRLYYENECKKRGNVHLNTREQVLDFLRSYFPISTKNNLGVEEDTLAYIMRHTQLQPRHVIMYCNSIFKEQRKIDPDSYPKISEEAVGKGIANAEHQLCNETFSGYKAIYPTARKVCESCIPHLPFVFTHGEAQKVFNQYGRKSSELRDYGDFKQLLIECGIVGRVMNDAGRYITGLFEYTERHKLIVSTKDKMCLHPTFAKVYNYKKDKKGNIIYPYGSDPNSVDHRDW